MEYNRPLSCTVYFNIYRHAHINTHKLLQNLTVKMNTISDKVRILGSLQ